MSELFEFLRILKHSTWLDYRANPLPPEMSFLMPCSCRHCVGRNKTAIKTLTHAYFSSRLHYCNVLHCGITEGLFSRILSVQNEAARFITGLGWPERSGCLVCDSCTGCQFVNMCSSSYGDFRLPSHRRELHRPQYLSDECHLASSVGEHAYVAVLMQLSPVLTIVTVIDVLSLPVLVGVRVWNTFRSCFNNRHFSFTCFKVLLKTILSEWRLSWRFVTTRENRRIKYSFTYLLTYLLEPLGRQIGWLLRVVW